MGGFRVHGGAQLIVFVVVIFLVGFGDRVIVRFFWGERNWLWRRILWGVCEF